jgi:histone-lysine N-methyltransferase SETMAR
MHVETKEQSKQWMHIHSIKKPKKFKQTLSACQNADGNALLGQERSAIGRIHAKEMTVMSEVYCETLTELLGVIQNKMHVLLTYSVVLLYDNVRPHTTARTQALLEHFNRDLFDHPPYSPDLASSDYHLFTYLRNQLLSQRFNSNEELMEVAKTWLSSQVADIFDTHTHTQKLIPRCKGLKFGGDYIEK